MSVGGRRGQRSVAAAVAVAVVLAVAWWVTSGSPEPSPPSSSSVVASSSDSSSTPAAGSPSSEDPDSGLAWVAESDLPAQARTTLAAIDRGGPYRYRCCDDTVFRNDERRLPQERRGYYREYTVTTPGSPDRGPRRIVAGSGGELYYTADHYRSFERIRR